MATGPSQEGWRKSTSSETSNCVEVRFHGPHVFVRDSKNQAGAVLSFTESEWSAFVAGVHRGEFDQPREPPAAALS